MDKLIFLGTGAAATLERRLTSLLFITPALSFLIDCGDGMETVRLINKYTNLEQLNHIFITHRHADHIIGLGHLFFTKLILNENSLINLYGPEQTLNAVKKVVFLTHDYLKQRFHKIKFIPLKSEQVVTLNPLIKVTGIKIKGPDNNPIVCYGYSVQVGKDKVTFSGDMQPNPNFNKLAQNSDILIHECFDTSPSELIVHQLGHSTAKDAALAALKANSKHLYLTHIQRQQRIGNVQNLIDEAKQYFKGKLTLAEDLMEINI